MEVLSLSDADDQMGGTGGDTGPRPGGAGDKGSPSSEKSSTTDPQRDEDDAVTEESKESFPASDPPANY